MNLPPALPVTATYKDWRGGLVVFGVVLILSGCLWLLLAMVDMGTLVAGAAKTGDSQWRLAGPMLLMYGGLATNNIWLGIGSILARRWARALILIQAWGWLVMGAILVPVMLYVLPKSFKAAAKPALPAEAGLMLGVVFTLMCLVFLVMPLAFILFYQHRNTQLTCAAQDPVARWTDACPLPVLGLAVVAVLAVLTVLQTMLLANAVFPLFGWVVHGWLGMLVGGVMAVAWGYCARALYRLRLSGWWAFLALNTAVVVSWLLTDRERVQRLSGYSPELLQQSQQLTGPGFEVLSVMAGMVAVLGYLVWVRRYFAGPAQDRACQAAPVVPL